MPARDIYHDIVKQALINDESAFKSLFEEPIGKLLLKNKRVKLIVFDPRKKEILRWIN
ncbi:MAG: hypothetical protein ACREEM_24585 [Blastocatellia bacterium]